MSDFKTRSPSIDPEISSVLLTYPQFFSPNLFRSLWGEHFKGPGLLISPILSPFLRRSPWVEHFQELKISTLLVARLHRRLRALRACVDDANV